MMTTLDNVVRWEWRIVKDISVETEDSKAKSLFEVHVVGFNKDSTPIWAEPIILFGTSLDSLVAYRDLFSAALLLPVLIRTYLPNSGIVSLVSENE